jgi:choline-sulfatase
MVASFLDPHDIYNFKRDAGDLTGVSTPLPPSWAGEKFNDKPSVQKQFMTDDQGTVIWGAEQKWWEWYHEYYKLKVKLYDDYLGKVIQALKNSGAWENTVLVVSSDHGDMDTQHRLIYKGPFMYEHMVRIPLLVRVPESCGGAVPRQVSDYQGVNTDIAPTILDFAGLAPVGRHGRSLKPMLTGGETKNREYVIGQYYSKQKWVNPIRMIRTPEFKFNQYILHGEELYDLRSDPDELVNLAGDAGYATKRNEMKSELDLWIERETDEFYSMKPTDRDGVLLDG